MVRIKVRIIDEVKNQIFLKELCRDMWSECVRMEENLKLKHILIENTK